MNKIKLLDRKIEARWPQLESRGAVGIGIVSVLDIIAIFAWLIIHHVTR